MTPLLETIIALIFIFMAFSLITSWIVEFISMLLQRRGTMLHDYLKHALNDNFNKNWGLMLYAHPLVEALGREISPNWITRWIQNSNLTFRRRLPQYIPAEQFAITLIDLIMTHERQTLFHKDDSGAHSLVKENFTMEESFAVFTAKLNSLQESEIKNTLITLTRLAHHKTEPFIALHTEIETWYNNSMERLNGWYKRSTRGWLFCIGIVVAFFFNVNAIEVVTRMYSDPQMRSATVAAAERILQDEPISGETTEKLDTLQAKIERIRTELSPLNLPIGRNLGELKADTFPKPILYSLAGWLITGLALSFGAPFWFDVLKGLVNMRSAGLFPGTKKQ